MTIDHRPGRLGWGKLKFVVCGFAGVIAGVLLIPVAAVVRIYGWLRGKR